MSEDVARDRGWLLWKDHADVGDVLVADHTAPTTVLRLADAEPFDETGGTLTVNGVILRYKGVDPDADTVTLIDPLTFPAAEGDPVNRWDVTAGATAKEFEGQVELENDEDGDDDPVDVVISHALGDRLPDGVREGRGESVVLERKGLLGRWSVVDVVGSPLAQSTDYLMTPGGRGWLTNSRDVPHNEFVVVSQLTLQDLKGVTYDRPTGVFTADEAGEYLVIFSCRLGSDDTPNGAGFRSVRLVYTFLDGTEVIGNVHSAAPLENTTNIQVTDSRRLEVGQGVRCEVRQTSGQTIQMVGSNDRPGFRPTNVRLTRLHG